VAAGVGAACESDRGTDLGTPAVVAVCGEGLCAGWTQVGNVDESVWRDSGASSLPSFDGGARPDSGVSTWQPIDSGVSAPPGRGCEELAMWWYSSLDDWTAIADAMSCSSDLDCERVVTTATCPGPGDEGVMLQGCGAAVSSSRAAAYEAFRQALEQTLCEAEPAPCVAASNCPGTLGAICSNGVCRLQ
jgi:hypothetical protein